jgi:hypothetical protein
MMIARSPGIPEIHTFFQGNDPKGHATDFTFSVALCSVPACDLPESASLSLTRLERLVDTFAFDAAANLAGGLFDLLARLFAAPGSKPQRRKSADHRSQDRADQEYPDAAFVLGFPRWAAFPFAPVAPLIDCGFDTCDNRDVVALGFGALDSGLSSPPHLTALAGHEPAEPVNESDRLVEEAALTDAALKFLPLLAEHLAQAPHQRKDVAEVAHIQQTA